jgi:tetratricopeptide (TPR) repeat protein
MFKSSWKSVFLAIAVAVTFAVGALSPPTASAAEEKVSNAVGKKLQEALKLATDKKIPEALAKAKEAQAQAKSPFDTFKTYDILAYLNIKAGDYPAALRAFEQIIDSQYLEEAQRAQYVKTMTQLYFQTKSYGKTVEFGQRWLKNSSGDIDAIVLVGQSYYLQKDCKNATRYMDQAIEASQHAGKPVKEVYFQIKLQCATDAKNSAGEIDALEDLVAHFPKKDYWNGLLTLLARDVPDRTMLHFYRLKFDTDTLTSASDYEEMAQLAVEFGYPGEAQTVLERGFATKVLENDKDVERHKRLLESSKKTADSDRKSLSMFDKEARNNKTGEADVKLGFAYLTYGDSAKAIEAIERGVGKGGVKNPAEAKIFLGMAYLKAKHADEAKKAFRDAKDDQLLGRIAKLWLLRAEQS